MEKFRKYLLIGSGTLLYGLFCILSIGWYRNKFWIPLTQQNKNDVTVTSSQIQEEAETKRIALTFDDGPHTATTQKLLDGLAERGIPATFFVIGKEIPGKEDLIRRMDAEGHLIGNHTYDHVKLCDLDGEMACAQIQRTNQLIYDITGKETEFIRPPFGDWNKKMECRFVMIPVLWDIDPLDWTTKNTRTIVERVLAKAADGDIILLHDCYDTSVDAALRIADELTARGFEFVTVDQLILE